tara:strand:- start:1450 stop:3075 length:1626 start_codon:yes stop_codon:yes gene_type:complete
LILDFVPSTGAYTLTVPRSSGVDVKAIVEEHGLDFSIPASTAENAVLFTREPYAAASFSNMATPAAADALAPLLREIEASWAPDSPTRIACPSDRELWGFQRADISYALRRRNVLVGDQPGLGKTPIAICYGNEIQAERILVIVPASIRLQWIKQIRAWTTMPWPYSIHGIFHSRHGVHPKANWTVVSYELARQPAIWTALSKLKFDLLIMDEAHYAKTIDSRRTRAIFGGGHNPVADPLAECSERVMALTGTPLPNRPREAYTLARGLCWDSVDWMSEDTFRGRFNPSIKRIHEATGKIWIDERTGRHGELQNRMRANFMTRHLKRDVLPQLKLPVYDLIQVEETGPVKQALKAEQLLDIDPENLAGADATILGHVAEARRLMGVALAPQVADYVDMLIDGGEEKIVLFAWHIEVLDILEERLANHHPVRVDGRTSSNGKEERVQRFINDPKCQVIMGNVLSLGTGTDGLQHVAWHALIAEPDWTPGNNIQCFDRLDRGGQLRTVQGDIFVAPGSIAERVLASALRKLQTTHKALDRRIT